MNLGEVPSEKLTFDMLALTQSTGEEEFKDKKGRWKSSNIGN